VDCFDEKDSPRNDMALSRQTNTGWRIIFASG
jgi:hypothetical protein